MRRFRLHKHTSSWLRVFPLLLIVLFPFHGIANSSLYNKIEITVIDGQTNEPIIGANIYTEDYSFTTTTDFDGKAVLEGLKYRDKVIISFIGYKTLELPFYEIRRKKGGIIKMDEEVFEFEGIEVVGRRDDRPEEIPYQIDRITSGEIAFSNAQTSADILEKNGGLFVQKSQMGGGSPIIRGFEANRVLLVIDGVRMNNAIYRNGHLQNSITVDPATLEQAEVIYGPGSLTYGSDALGGVVHYRTKDPKLAFGDDKQISEANAYLRYSSANTEKAVHVDFNQGGRKWGSFTSFSFVDYGNLVAGSVRPAAYPKFGLQQWYATNLGINSSSEARENLRNPNKQWGTKYAQIDILQKVKFQPSDKLYFVGNVQYSSSSDVPRYDNLVDTLGASNELKWVDWYYGPQQRILGSIKTRILDQGVFDKGTIIASFQRIDEDQYKRKFGKSWRSSTETDVYVYALTADFDKNLDESERLVLSYGADVNKNVVFSSAYERNVRTGQTHKIRVEGSDIITRYPSGSSSMDSYGAYLNAKWKSENDRLTAEAGLRYSLVKLASQFSDSDPIAWPQNYLDGIFLQNSALTYGGGFTYRTEDKWQFRGLAATAFRSPNIDDFAKIREKNGYVTIPNPNLAPEKAFTVETTIAKELGGIQREPQTGTKTGTSLKLSVTAFGTQLKDAIVRKNFALPDGSNLLEKDNEILETQSNVNAETAQVYGLSGNLKFSLADKWMLESSMNMTKGISRFQDNIEGIEIDTMVPFAHIPPLYGRTSLTFQTDKLKLSGVVQYNGRKRPSEYAVSAARISQGQINFNRTGTSDNFEYSPYGFVDSNGDPCIAVGARGDESECRQDYAGSLAWMTYNFYGDYQINEKFSINFGVENILDLHYRPFSSGVSAAGRNVIFGIRGKF